MTASTTTGEVPARTRQIELAGRPSGAPVPDDFRLAEVDLPAPGDGSCWSATW